MAQSRMPGDPIHVRSCTMAVTLTCGTCFRYSSIVVAAKPSSAVRWQSMEPLEARWLASAGSHVDAYFGSTLLGTERASAHAVFQPLRHGHRAPAPQPVIP